MEGVKLTLESSLSLQPSLLLFNLTTSGCIQVCSRLARIAILKTMHNNTCNIINNNNSNLFFISKDKPKSCVSVQ